MTAALFHLTRSRASDRGSEVVEPVAIAREPLVADQGESPPDTEPNSSAQLLLLSAVWASLVGSGCVLGQPWRTGAFEMSITVATLFGLAAVLGLVLLVGFFQETGAALAAGAARQPVARRYAHILVAAVLVVATVVCVVSGLGTRIGFGRVQARYDQSLESYRTAPTGSVRIAGVSYLVDAGRNEIRFEPTDGQAWGPPVLVWVRDGGRPNVTVTPAPTELGGGWYME